MKAPKLLKEAKAAKAPRKYKKGGTRSPPALPVPPVPPSRTNLAGLIKLPDKILTSSTTTPEIPQIYNLPIQHPSQEAASASTSPKAVAAASASPVVASTSPIKKISHNDKLLSIFTLYENAKNNEGIAAFKVYTAELLNTLKAIFNKGELYKTIEDDLKELNEKHIYIDENHKAYKGKGENKEIDEKRKQLKDLLIGKQKIRDKYFLTYIDKHYIEPYFIQDNDVVRTTDKFKERYTEGYTEFEEEPIKEQEFEDFLNVLDNIIEDVPTDEMDVYAIISHFKRAYEKRDENKETADNFKLYAGILLKSLRLINEDVVIRKELNILEELDKLKSVKENYAFLSRIFTTYIRPHLVINGNTYRFKDLSEKITELQIKRDGVEAILTDVKFANNRKITTAYKRNILRGLRQEQEQRHQQRQEQKIQENNNGFFLIPHPLDRM